MTISGDRSSVPPIGGTTRRTGRSNGNVSAFSTPASGPSGATHDRIACANTTMIDEPQQRLDERDHAWRAAGTRFRGRAARTRGRTRTAAPAATRTGRRTRDSSDAQSMPPNPGSTLRSGLTIQSVSAITAWPSGLRNGARISCMTRRSSSVYVKRPKTTSIRIGERVVRASVAVRSRQRAISSPSSRGARAPRP